MTQPTHIGRYAIRREIGRGAMGIVYEALDPVLERTVAIKTIQLDVASEATARYEERFLLEARAAGGLNHPSIVTIYDVGRSAEGAYICMEFLEGRELKELMTANGLTMQRALDIAAQVADGLAYAHERGVVHRDIKPANIMILAGDRAKIADFGIARKRTPEATMQSEVIVGSPGYLSPEQVLGKPCDGRSDIFSLGVILYQMVAGCLPFRGGDVSELLQQIVHTEPPAPSAANAEVPAMLDRIVAKALAKDAAGRYPDAAALAADLRACSGLLEGVTIMPLQARASEDGASITAELFETEAVARTDELDGAVLSNAPPLHGLAKAFDSSAAVARFATCESSPNLAKAVFADSGDLARPAAGFAEASAEPDGQPAVPAHEAKRWSRRDRVTFVGAVAVALVVGAAIVLR
jgi:serine/threonine-protein kinase